MKWACEKVGGRGGGHAQHTPTGTQGLILGLM